MARLLWATDADGDLLLSCDGRHYGLLCPHHEGFFRVASMEAGDGDFDTLEEAKAYLEACASGEEPTMKPRPFALSLEQQFVGEIARSLVRLLG